MIALLTIFLVAAAPLAAQSQRELIVAWPGADARADSLLREVGATLLITPLQGSRPAVKAVPVIAELPEAKSVAELSQSAAKAKSAGYEGAAAPAIGEEKEFREFLKAQNGFVRLVYLKPPQMAWDVAPATAVLAAGNWPGLQAADTASAAATEKPWINSNLHLYAYLRAFYPNRTAWLMTKPDKPDVRYDSVEVALAESFASGGNSILTIPEMYREGLLKGDARATASWKSLARFAGHLRNQPGFQARGMGSSTLIVAGPLEEFEEILNLPFRDNLSPRVAPEGKLPPLAPGRTRVLAVVNQEVGVAEGRQATDFAKAGGIVVTAPASDKDKLAWLTAANPKKIKEEKPWAIWELGKGTAYVYPEPILDPSSFTYDLKEISGQDNPRHTGLHGLDFRVWNASTILGVLYEGASGGKTLVLTSFGQGRDRDFLVGVRGNFASGTLLKPSGKVEQLELMKRGWFVEFNLKGIERQGIIELREATK